MSRIAFLMREALVNLRRNALVVVGAILAVFISLSLAFGALVLNELVQRNTLTWQDGTHVIAWLKDADQGGLETAGQLGLMDEIQAWEQVETTRYVDKLAAFEEFELLFGERRPELVQEINPNALPTSIRIELTDIDLYRDVVFRLKENAAVLNVTSAGEQIEQLSSLSTVLNVLGLGLAVLLGISAVILIANTIRMAIYARRDEVSIMKLVGASNWFIRVPFVLEGMIEGILGAGLAVLTVWIASQNLVSVGDAIPLLTLDIPTSFFITWGVMFIGFGALAGIVGSVVGLSRYLREADGGGGSVTA